MNRYSAYIGHTLNNNPDFSRVLQNKYCDFVNVLQSKYHNELDEGTNQR